MLQDSKLRSTTGGKICSYFSTMKEFAEKVYSVVKCFNRFRVFKNWPIHNSYQYIHRCPHYDPTKDSLLE